MGTVTYKKRGKASKMSAGSKSGDNSRLEDQYSRWSGPEAPSESERALGKQYRKSSLGASQYDTGLKPNPSSAKAPAGAKAKEDGSIPMVRYPFL